MDFYEILLRNQNNPMFANADKDSPTYKMHKAAQQQMIDYYRMQHEQKMKEDIQKSAEEAIWKRLEKELPKIFQKLFK